MTAVVFADLVGSTGLYERVGGAVASRFITAFSEEMGQSFQAHQGRVVKLLGDGVFVVFEAESDAVQACLMIQRDLAARNLIVPGDDRPVQLRMGIETGEVEQIGGDCFGDAVNVAARLADLAGPEQILTTARVHAALPAALQGALHALGPVYVRGLRGPVDVYRVAWQQTDVGDETVMYDHTARRGGRAILRLSAGGVQLTLAEGGEPLAIGRGPGNALPLTDNRVSRLHATVQVSGRQFILSDLSSGGTWVYLGDQPEPLVLRRTQCFLVGRGQIGLGWDAGQGEGPVVNFHVLEIP